MHLIEIFLPLTDNDGSPIASVAFEEVRNSLTAKFGGLTAFIRAPAEGTEKNGARQRADQLVIFEVMADTLDAQWWKAYRRDLEAVFSQDRILIRASTITLL